MARKLFSKVFFGTRVLHKKEKDVIIEIEVVGITVKIGIWECGLEDVSADRQRGGNVGK